MSVNIKENNALTRVAGNAADLNKWIGPKAEWDALDHDTIPEGTEVIITDDEYPTKVCRTVSECVDNIDENALAGASTVKEMNGNLSFPDGIGFYPDIKDGVRGYNTDAARGADTFVPFNSGKSGALTEVSTSSFTTVDLGFIPKMVIVFSMYESTRGPIILKLDVESNKIYEWFEDASELDMTVTFSDYFRLTTDKKGFMYKRYNTNYGVNCWYVAI